VFEVNYKEGNGTTKTDGILKEIKKKIKNLNQQVFIGFCISAIILFVRFVMENMRCKNCWIIPCLNTSHFFY
jgi:hypothetical protein